MDAGQIRNQSISRRSRPPEAEVFAPGTVRTVIAPGKWRGNTHPGFHIRPRKPAGKVGL